MKINHSICPLDGDWLGHRPADLGCHLLSSENDGDDDDDNGDDDDDDDDDGGGDDDVDVNCDYFNDELESEFFDYFRNVRAKWNSNQSVDISTGIMHMFEFVTRKYNFFDNFRSLVSLLSPSILYSLYMLMVSSCSC